MKPWFLLAALLASLSEFVDFFYLFHVSLRDEQLWAQFGVGYVLYYITSLLGARFLIPEFRDYKQWMVASCFIHILLVPIFFSKIDYLFILGLCVVGFFRMDTIATLALFSIADPNELSRRSFQLKIVYYIAQVGASVVIFLMWVYPVMALELACMPHVVMVLAGILIWSCTRNSAMHAYTNKAPETAMAKRVYHLELQVTCDYYGLSTFMMVFFVHKDVVMLPVTNIAFALVCIGLVFVGYRFVRKDNVNTWYIVYISFLVLGWIVSGFAFIFDADRWIHPAVHLVVVLMFAMIHIAPWNVLFQLEPGNHSQAMVEHRIIGQALGFFLGLGVYQGWGVAVYLPLFALGIYAVISYEKEYLTPSSASKAE